MYICDGTESKLWQNAQSLLPLMGVEIGDQLSINTNNQQNIPINQSINVKELQRENNNIQILSFALATVEKCRTQEE